MLSFPLQQHRLDLHRPGRQLNILRSSGMGSGLSVFRVRKCNEWQSQVPQKLSAIQVRDACLDVENMEISVNKASDS